jgi:hypothetical protein
MNRVSKLTNWDYLFYLEAFKWAKNNGFSGTQLPLLAVSFARLNSKVRAPMTKTELKSGLHKSSVTKAKANQKLA